MERSMNDTARSDIEQLGASILAHCLELVFSSDPPARCTSRFEVGDDWMHIMRCGTDSDGHPLWPRTDTLYGIPVRLVDGPQFPRLVTGE
jgi:hypothetical protein